MSYIRMGHPLIHVKGNSKDYVFRSTGSGTNPTLKNDYIEDYGNITNEGFIELLFRYWNTWDTDDELFKNHLLKKLAERLNVKLRKKPLTDKEYNKLCEEDMKKEGIL